jgi:hypothetical protein
MRCVVKAEPYVHTGAHGAVHPAPACNFQKSFALGFIEVAHQSDGSVNGVDTPDSDVTVRELRWVPPVVDQLDANILQRDLLSLRIHAERDRRTGTQSR